MADLTKPPLWLLHGVNLDMLGRRDPRHYGTLTLAELERRVEERAAAHGLALCCRQTNYEGRLVEYLHDLVGVAISGLIINPGAWTHYSYALRDALELIEAPIAEVHLSAVEQREEWRRRSVISDVVDVTISGHGADGYDEAVDALLALRREGKS